VLNLRFKYTLIRQSQQIGKFHKKKKINAICTAGQCKVSLDQSMQQYILSLYSHPSAQNTTQIKRIHKIFLISGFRRRTKEIVAILGLYID
jgi:hypothetical protein